MSEKADTKVRDVLHNPFKDVDVRAVEAAIAKSLGSLLKQRLSVDIQNLDFNAGSHRTARITLTASVMVDLGLLRGSRPLAASREHGAAASSGTHGGDEPARSRPGE